MGKTNFKCKNTPGEVFISILHVDYLPIVLDKIYTDSNMSIVKSKSKKIEEIERLKINK